MSRKLTIIFLLLGALLLTSCMSTSFSGGYTVPSGRTLRGNLFVTEGTVTLQENSRVTGTILMTSGKLIIGKNAQVGGDVALTSGELTMADGSVVHGDVIFANEDILLRQSPGATVEGNITYNIAPFAISIIAKGLFLYCILPIAVLVGLFLLLGVWLGKTSKKRSQVAPAPEPAATEDVQQKLEKLKSMLDQGLITEADYQAKKADILSKM
jgi:hypothetical protein